MAPGQPAYSQDGTPQSSVPADRLERIRRARRVIAAHLAVPRADHRAVDPDQAEQHPPHPALPCTRRRDPATSRASAVVEALPAGSSARNTSRLPGGNVASRGRTRCRRRRRNRLRSTAPPTPRPTAKPTRTPSDSTRCRWATTVSEPARPPQRRTSVNSRVERSRCAAGSTVGVRRPGGNGPCAGGRTRWRARLWSASAAGSRASCAVAGCWAGTCACSRAFAPLIADSGRASLGAHAGRPTGSAAGVDVVTVRAGARPVKQR